MTQKEFTERYKTDMQLHEVARDISGSIVIREYINGSSQDIRRAATDPEKKILENIAYSALLAYRHRGGDEDCINGILDMAEFALMQFIPTANTYDSIYIPLRKVTKTSHWA